MEATGRQGALAVKKNTKDLTVYPRTWVKTKDDSCNQEGVRFTVVTYNVLTDLAISETVYLYCPEEHRYMKDRHPRILAEVNTMNADVVCLQEVDVDHWNHSLRRDMEGMGYKGVFFESYNKEGRATFYKDSVFTLLDEQCAYHHDLAETFIKAAPMDDSLKEEIKTSIKRTRGTILVKLQHASGHVITVANVHINWDVLKYPALQALQVSAAVNRLIKFAGGADKPHIICGDFNTPPHFPAYHMLTHSHLTQDVKLLLDKMTDHLDQKDKLPARQLVELLPDAFCFQTDLKSAYKTCLGQEPAVTNCDDDEDDWPGRGELCLCLDYLWFSHNSLAVSGVLETPPVEAVVKHHALPSVLFPSDHLPLKAEFVFKQ